MRIKNKKSQNWKVVKSFNPLMDRLDKSPGCVTVAVLGHP